MRSNLQVHICLAERWQHPTFIDRDMHLTADELEGMGTTEYVIRESLSGYTVYFGQVSATPMPAHDTWDNIFVSTVPMDVACDCEECTLEAELQEMVREVVEVG